jgi:hypothetical protein
VGTPRVGGLSRCTGRLRYDHKKRVADLQLLPDPMINQGNLSHGARKSILRGAAYGTDTTGIMARSAQRTVLISSLALSQMVARISRQLCAGSPAIPAMLTTLSVVHGAMGRCHGCGHMTTRNSSFWSSPTRKPSGLPIWRTGAGAIFQIPIGPPRSEQGLAEPLPGVGATAGRHYVSVQVAARCRHQPRRHACPAAANASPGQATNGGGPAVGS